MSLWCNSASKYTSDWSVDLGIFVIIVCALRALVLFVGPREGTVVGDTQKFLLRQFKKTHFLGVTWPTLDQQWKTGRLKTEVESGSSSDSTFSEVTTAVKSWFLSASWRTTLTKEPILFVAYILNLQTPLQCCLCSVVWMNVACYVFCILVLRMSVFLV